MKVMSELLVTQEMHEAEDQGIGPVALRWSAITSIKPHPHHKGRSIVFHAGSTYSVVVPVPYQELLRHWKIHLGPPDSGQFKSMKEFTEYMELPSLKEISEQELQGMDLYALLERYAQIVGLRQQDRITASEGDIERDRIAGELRRRLDNVLPRIVRLRQNTDGSVFLGLLRLMDGCGPGGQQIASRSIAEAVVRSINPFACIKWGEEA